MTEVERISCFAGVPRELAEIVVTAATLTRHTVRSLRSSSKARELILARRWVVKRAKPRFSYWEIGRALNRDHSTVFHHDRLIRSGIEPAAPGRARGRQLELLR